MIADGRAEIEVILPDTVEEMGAAEIAKTLEHVGEVVGQLLRPPVQ